MTDPGQQWRIIEGDAREVLAGMDDQSVNDNTKERKMSNGELFSRYREVLAAVRQHDRRMLRSEACHLKQRGGECWAIGEMVERACLQMDVEEVSPTSGVA